MSEAEAELETETPVNPYSLLQAVNDASGTAHTAWLIFVGLMAYLMIAVAGVSHKDLLLETPVSLPIMQVQIQQTQFFQFASLMLVLFHLGLIAQLVLIAHKTLEFDAAVRALEISDRRTHPLRLELHNFFFVQSIAGPSRSPVMAAFLHGMSWLTLVVLPVLLLLFIQISYLPQHDVLITWVHRICLVLDILVLVSIGVFLLRAETSFFSALTRTSVQHPVSFALTSLVMLATTAFSFCIATVPGEALDRVTALLTAPANGTGPRTAPAALGALQRADGALLGLFNRNLAVTDLDVAGLYTRDSDTTVSLRGRDLRNARLDRTNLRRADLTGADLTGASLVGADLTEAKLQCADVAELIVSRSRTNARCTSAAGANLTRAQLSGAKLAGLDLTRARLDDANLQAAELPLAIVAGASFVNAQLAKANLQSASGAGASFLAATLQGADLTGAELAFADFSGASLQAAIFAHANLNGTRLPFTDLEAADLHEALLLGSDLTGAKMRAADLRRVRLWITSPPARDSLMLTDLGDAVLKPLDADEQAAFAGAVEALPAGNLKTLAAEALKPVLTPATMTSWNASPDYQTWTTLIATARLAGDTYGQQLTDYLVAGMCLVKWTAGAFATGVALRAQTPDFRGNTAAVLDRLKAPDCAGQDAVSRTVLQSLASQVEQARQP